MAESGVLQKVILPIELMSQFANVADSNTVKGLETFGAVCGYEVFSIIITRDPYSRPIFVLNDLLICINFKVEPAGS
jgi:hypothetical protein